MKQIEDEEEVVLPETDRKTTLPIRKLDTLAADRRVKFQH